MAAAQAAAIQAVASVEVIRVADTLVAASVADTLVVVIQAADTLVASADKKENILINK